jgi:UDP-N-acetylglucosamine acyltransferase
VHRALDQRRDAVIHPTAIVEAGARLAPDVSVGAFSLIGPQVEIGEGSWVGPHVVIEGRTRIGRNNRVYQFASIGAPPQDKKYAGEDTAVEIGDGNTLREYVTINRGTWDDARVTRVGNDNWIMAYVHFAHDCQIGNHCIFANYTGLAGHVKVGDWATLGGSTVVHQFVRIGAYSFTGMETYLDRDLPPFVRAAGNMAQPYGINTVGLRRRGMSGPVIDALKRAYKTIYRHGLGQEEVRRELEVQARNCAEVGQMLEFLNSSKRGYIR